MLAKGADIEVKDNSGSVALDFTKDDEIKKSLTETDTENKKLLAVVTTGGNGVVNKVKDAINAGAQKHVLLEALKQPKTLQNIKNIDTFRFNVFDLLKDILPDAVKQEIFIASCALKTLEKKSVQTTISKNVQKIVFSHLLERDTNTQSIK